jgi:hypothetical protein
MSCKVILLNPHEVEAGKVGGLRVAGEAGAEPLAFVDGGGIPARLLEEAEVQWGVEVA